MQDKKREAQGIQSHEVALGKACQAHNRSQVAAGCSGRASHSRTGSLPGPQREPLVKPLTGKGVPRWLPWM